jgi:hypothetical protein
VKLYWFENKKSFKDQFEHIGRWRVEVKREDL